VSVVSKRRPSPSSKQRGPKPPSTFGDTDDELGDPSSPVRKHQNQFRNVSKLEPSE